MDDLLNLISSDSQYVVKRSGDTVIFEQDKIKNQVLKAMESVGTIDIEMAEKVARLTKKSLFRGDKHRIPHVDEVHDMVENKLMDNV